MVSFIPIYFTFSRLLKLSEDYEFRLIEGKEWSPTVQIGELLDILSLVWFVLPETCIMTIIDVKFGNLFWLSYNEKFSTLVVFYKFSLS